MRYIALSNKYLYNSEVELVELVVVGITADNTLAML